jgi:hypothetical protein
MKRLVAFAVFASLLSGLAWSAACSPPSDARIGVDAPNEGLFPPVADLLSYRCGSLDCHGSIERNFIIWSCYGLRLEADAAPGCRNALASDPASQNVGGILNTTAAEYNATYRSLVGLEPAVMSQVVASGGADPDLLTFVQKARGEQDHKGGKLWDAGAPEDQCVAEWLADESASTAECRKALGGDVEAGLL